MSCGNKNCFNGSLFFITAKLYSSVFYLNFVVVLELKFEIVVFEFKYIKKATEN